MGAATGGTSTLVSLGGTMALKGMSEVANSAWTKAVDMGDAALKSTRNAMISTAPKTTNWWEDESFNAKNTSTSWNTSDDQVDHWRIARQLQEEQDYAYAKQLQEQQDQYIQRGKQMQEQQDYEYAQTMQNYDYF
jgi:hypothetical protein